MIGDYQQTIEHLLANLTKGNYSIAVDIAEIPKTIRGFGHIKEGNMILAKQRQTDLLKQFSEAQETVQIFDIPA